MPIDFCGVGVGGGVPFVLRCQSQSGNEKCHILLKRYSIQIWLLCIKSAHCEVPQRTNWVVSVLQPFLEGRERRKERDNSQPSTNVSSLFYGAFAGSPTAAIESVGRPFFWRPNYATRPCSNNAALSDALAGSSEVKVKPLSQWFLMGFGATHIIIYLLVSRPLHFSTVCVYNCSEECLWKSFFFFPPRSPMNRSKWKKNTVFC